MEEARPQIEEAFRKAMRENPDRFVNAFVDLIEDADGIGLDLSVGFAVKHPETDYERDC